MDSYSYLTGFLIGLLLYLFFEGARLAFIYSFKYRDADKSSDRLLEKILVNFYQIPGLFLASTRWTATIALLTGACMEYLLIAEWCKLAGWEWDLPLQIAAWLLVGVTFLLGGFAFTQLLCGRHPDQALKGMALPLYFIGILLLPFTRLLLLLPKLLLKIDGINLDDKYLARLFGGKELMENRQKPVLSVDKPDIGEKDLELFHNAIEFSNIRVHDCIVPRTEIVAVEISDPIEELINTFVKSGKTKIIVYQEDLDHIIGYVHSSDMFRSAARENWNQSIRQIPIVPESMSAQKMMQIFMQQKKSIAVVADEFGGTSGIISLEDLVEEIFGDIEDEHDVVTYTAKKVGDNEYLLSARLEIEKVNEQFGIHLPESDEYLTVGGYILYHHQAFPKTGQILTIDKFQFTIIKTATSKIELVKLKVNP